MKKLLEQLTDSMIDFPRGQELCPEIWVKADDGSYVIKESVKKKILKHLDEYPLLDLLDLAEEIRIVGSITSNQYADDADIDVHLVIHEERLPKDKSPEDWLKDVFKWFRDNREFIGEHPIEVYLQYNPAQDFLSPGIYDLIKDEWIKPPTIVPQEFNPYDVYRDIFNHIKYVVEPADLLFGELKRDVIDYETVKQALAYIPPEQREKVKFELEKKLEEIENDIRQLMWQKKRWQEARKLASQPRSVEQALRDIETAKEWADKNVIFKLLGRYGYMKTIKELENMLKDDQLTDDEIKLINDLLGGKNVK